MFDSNFFWILWGVVLVLVGAGFKTFAEDQGWKLNWWKWVLTFIWYVLFTTNFYLFGTLAGENESSAGFKLMLLGLFVCLILGVGLWRLMLMGGEPAEPKT